MARRNYIRDYRLVESLGENGRMRTDYEYIGGDYLFLLGAEAVRRERRPVLALLIVGWLAYAGALIPAAEGFRAIYVSLPFLFSALPLGLATEVFLSAMHGREPLRRSQADKLQNRFPPAALAAAVLPLISLAGELVRLLLGRAVNGGDLVFCLCGAALTASGAFLFSRRDRFLCRRAEEPAD